MKNYRNIRSEYLPHLQIDIVQNTIDHPSLLIKTASHLPCLAFLPEEDSKRILYDTIPNDLLVEGKLKYPVSQWGLLGPKSGAQFGANAVEAWDTFSGEYLIKKYIQKWCM